MWSLQSFILFTHPNHCNMIAIHASKLRHYILSQYFHLPPGQLHSLYIISNNPIPLHSYLLLCLFIHTHDNFHTTMSEPTRFIYTTACASVLAFSFFLHGLLRRLFRKKNPSPMSSSIPFFVCSHYWVFQFLTCAISFFHPHSLANETLSLLLVWC